MIEPTDEMRTAIGAACYGQLNDDERDAVAAAVLAIVARDRAAESVTEKRAALDAAIADALPISGGQVRKRLKQLRRALDDGDEVRKQRQPCARPGCGHILAWHRQDKSPFRCAGDLMHCPCEGWLP